MVATQICVFFSPRKFGKMSNLTHIFQQGSVQPPTRFAYDIAFNFRGPKKNGGFE